MMDRFTLPGWSPEQTLLLAAVVFALLILILLVWAVAASRRAGSLAAPLAQLSETTQRLGEGQSQLSGALQHVSQAQASAQLKLVESVERRLEEVQRRMGDSLHGSAQRTARSLGELQQRLEAIDKAQTKIEKLSGDVLGLQDILSNKQTRGAFGEIQLQDIVSKALPPDAFGFQVTLSNGRRADCLIRLPNPPGDIVVDAKFPLEAYEALRNAGDDRARLEAARALKQAVRAHIGHISERYLIEGETAEGALMFLPSEAVYAELHANFAEVVREGFDKRVWIVSPTTLMATLTTLRAILKDARMKKEASRIRRELGLLHADLGRLSDRVGKLDQHFAQAREDVEKITLSADKASRRAAKLESLDFSEEETVPAP